MPADLLSNLLRILNPKLKTGLTNLQILSAKDKAEIKDLTQKYAQYNISYIGRTEGPTTSPPPRPAPPLPPYP